MCVSIRNLEVYETTCFEMWFKTHCSLFSDNDTNSTRKLTLAAYYKALAEVASESQVWSLIFSSSFELLRNAAVFLVQMETLNYFQQS